MIADLLTVAFAALVPAAWVCGRWAEHRRWHGQVEELKQKAYDEIVELRCAEAHTLDIVRTQRDLLASFTAAADRLNHPSSGWLAREQIAWAAHRARTEVL